jgi:hypothetical protein
MLATPALAIVPPSERETIAEVVPGLVELEVAVPRPMPSLR